MIDVTTTDAKEIANYIQIVHQSRRSGLWTTTLAVTHDGYRVGIADQDIHGYTPTPFLVPISNYDEATKVVDGVNELLFPGRHAKLNFEIVASSMKKPV